jgi:hypothetical protein
MKNSPITRSLCMFTLVCEDLGELLDLDAGLLGLDTVTDEEVAPFLVECVFLPGFCALALCACLASQRLKLSAQSMALLQLVRRAVGRMEPTAAASVCQAAVQAGSISFPSSANARRTSTRACAACGSESQRCAHHRACSSHSQRGPSAAVCTAAGNCVLLSGGAGRRVGAGSCDALGHRRPLVPTGRVQRAACARRAGGVLRLVLCDRTFVQQALQGHVNKNFGANHEVR